MIADKSTRLSDAQAVTTNAATTNVIDTLAAGDAYVGAWAIAQVTTAFATAAGSATVTFQLQSDSAEGFTSNSAVTLATSSAISKDTLAAGYVAFRFRIPVAAVLRYIRGYFVCGGSAPNAGKVTWDIVKDIDVNRIFNV